MKEFHLYWTRDHMDDWKHSDKCWCKVREGLVNFQRMTRDVTTKYIGVTDKVVAPYRIAKRQIYNVTGDMLGVIQANVDISAESPEQAIKQAIEFVERTTKIITEKTDLKAELVE